VRGRSFAASTSLRAKAHDTPVLLDNFRRRSWDAILKRTKLRYWPVYQCRHTYATLLLENNDIRWAADQMGHVSIKMIIEHYARWVRKPESPGVKAASQAISDAQNKRTRRPTNERHQR
jgi:integrase